MKTIYKFLFPVLLCLPFTLFSQKEDDKRLKIEMTLMDGKNTTSLLKSFTTSYNRTLVTLEKNKEGKDELSGDTKPFYISMDFDRHDLSALKAFNQNRSGLDILITITDTYGKLPQRKFEFRSAVLDLLTDQVTTDYTSAYMTLGCMGLTIDGVKIEP